MPALRQQVEAGGRRLLNEINGDPYSPLRGCADRRYWGWKLVDFPDATLQRTVEPLVRLARLPGRPDRERLLDAAKSSLLYACGIQRSNGSFDQAFPYERSFGATAFLLASLATAYEELQAACDPGERDRIERLLRRAADFLCGADETHGFIANHRAGAAAGLDAAARRLDEPRYRRRADALLDEVLASQSPEGWFPEYEGADPGYQSLCVWYLALLRPHSREPRLEPSLRRAVEFLSWYAHPDGSFAGEYGSRRTAVFYPGGVALLARDMPMAAALLRWFWRGAEAGALPGPADVDTGNLAPLLSNYLLTLEVSDGAPPPAAEPLPCERGGSRDFPGAGLYVRASARYYAVVGAGNGGVLLAFDRATGVCGCRDGGYAGALPDGRFVTTQATANLRPQRLDPAGLELDVPFFAVRRPAPSPWRFVALRLLNLTVMRLPRAGELVKQLLVRTFVTGRASVPLRLRRSIRFFDDRIEVADEIRATGGLRLRWLEGGRAFVSIHMASAGYYQPGAPVDSGYPVDVERLAADGSVRLDRSIHFGTREPGGVGADGPS